MSVHPPGPVEVTGTDVQWRDGSSPLTLCIQRPGTGSRAGVIVFFHGGGFVHRNVAAAAAITSVMASRLNTAVITPMYAIASEAPFPAAVDDAYAAACWAVANAPNGGWDARKLVVVGVEAGGNLAAVTATMARDRGTPHIAAQVLVTPMLDPTQSSKSMHDLLRNASFASHGCGAAYRTYLPNAADRMHPYASPACCSRVEALPPALILTARDDPLRDEGEAYGAKLISAGVTTQVSRLARINAPDGSWTEDTWNAVTSFLAPRLDRRFAGSPSSSTRHIRHGH